MLATTMRSIKILSPDIEILRRAVQALQAKLSLNSSQPISPLATPSVEQKLNQIAQPGKIAKPSLTAFTLRRDPELSVPSAVRKLAMARPQNVTTDEQPAIALGTSNTDLASNVSVANIRRALSFPNNAEDRDGFRALRWALENRQVAKLIRAAQDVLTLLSQDGIYMKDLMPDRARPKIWRKFAQGERRREIASLGGNRDSSTIALTGARMQMIWHFAMQATTLCNALIKPVRGLNPPLRTPSWPSGPSGPRPGPCVPLCLLVGF